MDTMDTMYKLTKQIDALTYNSRAVLNALVRSCIAAGSSNGYTVRRFGVELTLDRTDIFRLYDFYQSWANGTYGYAPFTADPVEFDDIVAKCDAKWKGGEQLVTKAIVTHSKIMYLISANKDKDGTDFWLGLIRDSSSPKLITNSAPIPLNLRTPLYDADLSTKSFSQYETYLFPSGYNRLTITGMPGDGEEHVGGGKSWLWDVDESFEVTAPRILFGHHDNPKRRAENYGNTKHSMSFGYNTYALGERSATIGGMNCIAIGENSATLGGTRAFAIGRESAVVSGYISMSVGASTLASNYKTHAVGDYSIAGNQETVSGDFTYKFTIEEPESSGTAVECEVIRDTETGVCLSTEASAISGNGRNTVRIAYSYLESEGLWGINIAKGDYVTLYAQNRKEGSSIYHPTDDDGYAYKPLHFTVSNVTREEGSGDFLVQLDGSIPGGESFNSMWVVGGYITRSVIDLRDMDYAGRLRYTSKFYPGRASAVFNYHTFASGSNQTVVGQMNFGNRDAKFIVGTGSSYVGANALRRNGLVIAEGYGYMQTANRSASIGVSNYDGTVYRDYESRYLSNGAWMFHSGEGIYTGYARVHDRRTEIGLYREGTVTEDGSLTFVRSGSSYLSTAYDVTTRLESRAGTMVLCAGSYVGAEHIYDVLLQQGPLGAANGSKGVAIYSEHGMELRNTDSRFTMSFENSGYISAKFRGLYLHGNTWGALPTTDDGLSFWVYRDRDNRYDNPNELPGHCIGYANTIAQSGFFYGDNAGRAGSVRVGTITLPDKLLGRWNDWANGYHILNSSIKTEINHSGYDVSCLLMPGAVREETPANAPHIKFINSFVTGSGNNGEVPDTYVTEELAYLSDVKNLERRVQYTAIIDNSYSTVGDGNNVPKVQGVWYRRLNDDIELYPPEVDGLPGKSTIPFKQGEIASYTNSNRTPIYFGDQPIGTKFGFGFDHDEDDGKGFPFIMAANNYQSGIVFRRVAGIIACNLDIWFDDMDDEVNNTYFEYLVDVEPSIASDLDIGENKCVILNGTGVSGVAVTCTMNLAMPNDLQLDLPTPTGNTGKYYTRYMCQFVIRNPEKLKGTKVPVTLVGVVN